MKHTWVQGKYVKFLVHFDSAMTTYRLGHGVFMSGQIWIVVKRAARGEVDNGGGG